MRQQTHLFTALQILLLSVWSLPTWAQSLAEQYAALSAEIAVADKRCLSQPAVNQVARDGCFDALEIPIINTKAPVLVRSFEMFSSKRMLLAQKFDAENARAVEAMNQFRQGEKEAQAVLASREPKWLKPTQDSSLNRDLIEANASRVCASHNNLIEKVNCIDSLQRPIWERDAADTIKYYNEYHKKELQLAKAYNTTGAPKLQSLANEHWRNGLKQAVDELRSNIRQALEELVQQQQAVAAQSAAEQAREREHAANFASALAQGILQGAAIVAQARANAHSPSLNVFQDTPVAVQNSGVAPLNSRPTCSSYCQLMIQSGHVTANDPCAVQCAH
jgi:hypothetical protein